MSFEAADWLPHRSTCRELALLRATLPHEVRDARTRRHATRQFACALISPHGGRHNALPSGRGVGAAYARVVRLCVLPPIFDLRLMTPILRRRCRYYASTMPVAPVTTGHIADYLYGPLISKYAFCKSRGCRGQAIAGGIITLLIFIRFYYRRVSMIYRRMPAAAAFDYWRQKRSRRRRCLCDA